MQMGLDRGYARDALTRPRVVATSDPLSTRSRAISLMDSAIEPDYWATIRTCLRHGHACARRR
jgi:hypothetical protein